MDIYFLRHANAGEPKVNPARDEKRPLDKLGIEQSHDVGRALAALGVSPEVIISSPLRRAAQTAAVVANELGYEDKVTGDRKSTRLNSSHLVMSYAVFCLKKKKTQPGPHFFAHCLLVSRPTC